MGCLHLRRRISKQSSLGIEECMLVVREAQDFSLQFSLIPAVCRSSRARRRRVPFKARTSAILSIGFASHFNMAAEILIRRRTL